MESLENISTIDTLAQRIFGEGSSLADTPVVLDRAVRSVAMSDDLSYEILVLLFLVLYMIWIGRSLSNFDGLSFKVSNPFASISKSEGLRGVRRMGDIALDWSLVIVTIALFTTRLFDLTQIFHPSMVDIAYQITQLGLSRWMLFVALASIGVVLYGLVMTYVSCRFFRINGLDANLITLKSRLLRMSTVWLMPPVIMSALEGDQNIVIYLAVAVAVTFVGIYLFRTFLLFKAQKISILHWILYLCTVEILPLTLLWGVFARRSV